MNGNVGELTIALSFDKKGINSSLKSVDSQLRSGGKSAGGLFGNAFAVTAGNLVSSAISKITSAITSSIGAAIQRVDTIKNADKVFTAMGYTADSVSSSMNTLNTYLDGLPTSMTTAVQGVQSLSASFGGIEKGTEVFMDMNNAGLAFGATSAQIENAITQLGQLSLDGPLDAQTWNSLRNSGFSPVFAAMAKEAGITVGELKEQFGGKHATKTVGDFLNELHKLGTEGGSDMESLADLARKNTEGIGTAIENVRNRIAKAIAKIIDHIGSEKIAGAINKISGGFSKVADVVIGFIDFLSANQWIVDAIIGALITILTMGIASKVATLFSTIVTFVAANPIVAALTAIIFVITQVIMHFEDIKNFFISAFNIVSTILMMGLERIGNFFEATFQGIGDFFKTTFDVIALTAQTIFNNIKTAVQNVGDFFKGVFNGMSLAVRNIFSGIVGFFNGIFNTIKGIFINIGRTVGNIVGGAFRGVVNGVLNVAENIINAPIRAINSLIGVINEIPGVSIGTIGEWHLPRMAQGGLVTSATTAVIGEAGREAVLPLDRNTGWASLLADTLVNEMDETAGREIVVNMTNNIDSKLDAQEIGQIMMTSIRRAAA